MLVLVDGLNFTCQYADYDQEKIVDKVLEEILDTLNYLDPYFGTTESMVRCLFIWDPGTSKRTQAQASGRKELFQEYKANRRVQSSQIVTAKDSKYLIKARLLEVGIHSIEEDKLEADDIIAFIARLHGPKETIIISQDNDFLQLISPNVSIFRNQGWLDYQNFQAKIGIPPERYILWKAMHGDPSDNIPSVRTPTASWNWAVMGAQYTDLSDEEITKLEFNLSLMRLDLWKQRLISTSHWRSAKLKFKNIIEQQT